MKGLYILIVVALITITVTAVSFWLININPVYHIEEFVMDIYIDNVPGLNVDTDVIHFGKLPPTGSVGRRIDLISGPYRTRVTIESHGDIAEWVYVSKNNFIMDPEEETSFMINADVPENATVPDYKDGMLRIIFKRIA